MKALTLWQPWASLVAAGVKKYEFRTWPAPRSLIGERIVIHAAKRPLDGDECRDLIAPGGGLPESLGNFDHGAWREARELVKVGLMYRTLPLGAGVAEVTLGRPAKAIALFGDVMDPDTIDEDMWAWPMLDVEPFAVPLPARGAQGFWEWKPEEAAGPLFEGMED